jgi:octaprenyl-diphosphate synthase
LGDYIYSKAFQLIGNCGNTDIFACMSEAIHSMCQGELMHVCQRRNLDLSKDSYIVIAKKKTASLFAASCHAGTIIGNHSRDLQTALKEFGLNFGVAFQIVDDCRDVIGEEGDLGKEPGQDVIAGDITLPLLTLSDAVGQAEREEIKNMLGSANDKINLSRLRAMLANSDALCKTEQVVTSYLAGAKERLNRLADSVYKESLSRLVEHTTQRSF